MTPRPADIPTLAPDAAYRLWAPSYGEENPVSALDRAAVRSLGDDLRGARVLDAGCGTGRRLPDARAAGAARVVGIDLVDAMLRRAGDGRTAAGLLAAADVRALPFVDGAFDVVWCRLVLGHLPELLPAYSELARVLADGGGLLVTDFHPDATRAGHRRTFRDAAGSLLSVAHHLHDVEGHTNSAEGAALRLSARMDLPVGPEVRHFYEEADALDRYERDRGLPLVLALAFRK